jgi:formate--tetrahydrofolate ligase
MSDPQEPRPIAEIASAAGIQPDELESFGKVRAKINLSILDRLKNRPDGRIIIVTAITPTKAGEGKTTTSISLTQGLGKIGRKVVLALREPSMGPVFGIKGGGTGGGKAQIIPMEEINLHFNGDFHAVTSAHNLLAAALDASLFNGNPLRIDPKTITWPRAMDMNERQLRYVETGLGGTSHGVPRPSQFIITAASEIMASLALASDLADLKTRMGRIVVARDVDGKPVTADDLQVTGAMTIIMKEAIKPNLVQTMEGQPVLVHAGPFGNIAHGANSLVADRVAVKMADYIVTEAGFASDLGFQKFCDIVCRIGKMKPNAAVLVTTVRATKSHGGVAFNDLGKPDQDAIRRGADNLAQHVSIVKQYGLPCVVTINSFPTDTAEEVALVKELALKAGAETVVVHNGFGKGGEGAVDLARAVVEVAEKPSQFKLLTPEGTPVVEQIEAIVKRVYGGAGIELTDQAKKDLENIEALGLGTAPVCMAKSHLSLSHDAKLLNRPSGFTVPVRGLVASTGAGFVVAMCGEIQRMPGLGKTPAFQRMDINEQGQTVGLT